MLRMSDFTPNILIENGWQNYALLDSGDGRKLEQFGLVRVSRPEPQALWEKSLPDAEWKKADATFTNASEKEEDDKGSWQQHKKLPETWPVGVEGVNMVCRLMTYRHMGLFPEQRPHWQWFSTLIKTSKKPFKLLNLFGYTGAAGVFRPCRRGGARRGRLNRRDPLMRLSSCDQASGTITASCKPLES